MAISATTTAENNRGGSGRGYMPMRDRRQCGQQGNTKPQYRKKYKNEI